MLSVVNADCYYAEYQYVECRCTKERPVNLSFWVGAIRNINVNVMSRPLSEADAVKIVTHVS
jgi:hypothetical protein